jgi:hypothetical protein
LPFSRKESEKKIEKKKKKKKKKEKRKIHPRSHAYLFMLTRGSRNKHLTGLLDPVHISKRVTIKSKYENFDYFVCRFTTPKITCSCVEFDDRFCSKSVQKLAGQYYLPFCHLTHPSKA